MGNTNEEKDEQIKMLINEIKGIRSRLQNLVTFEGRINDFEEFLAIINKIKDYIYKSNDKEIQQCYEQLNILVENYELNGQKYYNKLIQEIFGINYCEEDEAEYNNENNENEEQNYINNNEENQNDLNYENEEIEHQNYDEINDNVNYKENYNENYQDNNEE